MFSYWLSSAFLPARKKRLTDWPWNDVPMRVLAISSSLGLVAEEPPALPGSMGLPFSSLPKPVFSPPVTPLPLKSSS